MNRSLFSMTAKALFAGVIALCFARTSGATTYYWTNDSGSTGSPESTDEGGKKYFFTEIPLNNLGSVSGAVTLTIKGNSKIGTDGDSTTGHVYGGGDQSTVDNTTTPANAHTIVTIQGNTEVLGNVYGGGNKGDVSGSAVVNIKDGDD